MYINTRTRNNADAREREELRGRAEQLGGRRGQFIHWMQREGYSRDRMDKELRNFDQVIENMQDRAE